jgi:S1-C subfamily serine protease
VLCALIVTPARGSEAPAAVQGSYAAPRSREARRVFERAQDKVLQIRVVLGATQSQATTGSGFLVDAGGQVLTNYHVVSGLALEPERHRLEYVRADGSRGSLELVAVDVVHDLALLRMPPQEAQSHFRIHVGAMRKGDRGYSLGNPLGVGLSIVEGTYNGLVEDRFYDLIHFTGAINPGMSGGPAVTPAGDVFGINVAIHRGGQLVAYLVPAAYARGMIGEAARERGAQRPDFRREIVRQLLRHQEAVLGRLLSERLPVQSLGRFVVPDRPAPFVRCWGHGDRQAKRRYEEDSISCGTEAHVYVGREIQLETVRFEHTLFRPRGMGAWRFARLLGSSYEAGREGCACSREQFTPYACSQEFVEAGGLTIRGAVCARAYKKFPGLYDLELRFVSVNSSEEGLVGKLTLSGVSYDLGMSVARRYLESLGWKP